MKKKRDLNLIWCDVLMGLSCLLYVLVRSLTVFFINYQTEITKVDVEQMTTLIEANPFARLLLNFKQIGYMGHYIMLPALMGGTYMFLRSRYKKGKVDIDSLGIFVYFIFFSLCLNLINDGALVLAHII